MNILRASTWLFYPEISAFNLRSTFVEMHLKTSLHRYQANGRSALVSHLPFLPEFLILIIPKERLISLAILRLGAASDGVDARVGILTL